MKKWILTATLLAIGSGSVYADEGKDDFIPCRDNDPFVFCTQGCSARDQPSKAWRPYPGTAGQYFVVPGYCPEGQYYGNNCISWQLMEIVALPVFKRVCKWPHQPGRWQGPGRPENTPHKH